MSDYYKIKRTFDLDSLYKELIEKQNSQTLKDLLVELGANPNSIGVSMYDIITMTPNQAKESFVNELKSKSPNEELIQNILEHSVIDINATHEIDDKVLPLIKIVANRNKFDLLRTMLKRPELKMSSTLRNSIFKFVCDKRSYYRPCEYKLDDIVKSLLNSVSSSVVINEIFNSRRYHFKDENSYLTYIKFLLSHKNLNVNWQNPRGDTALMWASWNGHTEIVRMLLERPEILVNLQDEDGETALMRASNNGRTKIVKLLLERPEIDVNLENQRCQTAFMLASKEGETKVANLLKEHSKSKKPKKAKVS